MSRVTQSRAQTEANAKILRALVKSPDNKVCVDCKKNDPRWASWNLGCFLCIRCSGIHRSMGTHISKVKSIDLDIWTPEQMDSVQKWGNRRCNLYWEAHLKPGHIPADHKIESFIRSKYESRRWAKDGPVPSDPSVLDADGGASAAAAATTIASSTATAAGVAVAGGAAGGAPKKSAAVDLLDDPSPAPATTTTRTAAAPTRTAAATSPPAAAPKPSGGGIFDLDWHDPSPSTVTSPSAASPTSTTASGTGAKGKNDIMSLFAAAPPVVPVQSTVSPPHTAGASSSFGDFGNFTSSAPLNNLTSGFGNLDLSSSSTNTSAKPSNSTTMGLGSIGNPWSTNNSTNASTTGAGTAGNGGLFDTHDVWGSSTTTNTNSSGAKKDDAFADIWGDFK